MTIARTSVMITSYLPW